MTAYNNPNDPNYLGDREVARDRGGNFWPWIIGLLVLLAVGWIVIEAFDSDDDINDGDAIPAASEMGDNTRSNVGTADPNNATITDPTLRDQTVGTDRNGSSPTANPAANPANNDAGNPAGGGAQ